MLDMDSETNSDRRRRKLTELCASRGLKKVATGAGVSQAALDQIIKGTLLPARKDGSRSARKLGDESARKIEASERLGHGWFDLPHEGNLPGERAASTGRIGAPPNDLTLRATIDRLGDLLTQADEKTRLSVAQLLLQYAQDPTSGERIAQAIEILMANASNNP